MSASRSGSPDASPSVRIRRDGPYVVIDVPVRREHAEDVLHSTGQTALCRCGRSAIKPFCDGNHRGVFDGGDTTAELGADEPGPALDAPAGIVVADDGPLWLSGPVPLQRSDGRLCEPRARIALCRCGASSTKPYCDGTHARIGFLDPPREGATS